MTNLSFEQLCNLIRQDPIQGARAAQRQGKNHRTREYELAALAYALAARLSQDPNSRAAFYRLPFFGGGNAPNAAYLLLHCTQFVREERRGPEAERVGGHARAMQPAFDAGWGAEQVLDALKTRGGFSGLEASFCQPQPNGPPAIGSNVHMPRDSVHEPPSDAGNRRPIFVPDGHKPEGNGISASPRPQPKEAKRSEERSANEMLDRFFMVEMEPPESIGHLFQLPVGQSRYMRVTRLEDELGGFVVFKGCLDVSPGLKPSRHNGPMTPFHPKHPPGD